MDYEILIAGSAPALAWLVQQKIKEGWRPLGGVSVSVMVNQTSVYAQAIVKEEGK